ncbi:MAG: nickel insertion protein [Ilumatobacteraceae bacterium]
MEHGRRHEEAPLGTDVTVVCPVEVEPAAIDVLFRWTTTLGVRRQPIDRYEADRTEVTVDVEGQPIRVKVRSWAGRTVGWKAEHDDVVEAARASGSTLPRWSPRSNAAWPTEASRGATEGTRPGSSRRTGSAPAALGHHAAVRDR